MNKNTVVTTLGALLVGGVSGFFGGGGGMLCVPLLEYCGMKTKQAHATAIAVILPVCLVSAAVYLINGYFAYNEFMAAAIGVVIGGLIGAKLLQTLDSSAVAIIFAVLMIVAGAKMALSF